MCIFVCQREKKERNTKRLIIIRKSEKGRERKKERRKGGEKERERMRGREGERRYIKIC